MKRLWARPSRDLATAARGRAICTPVRKWLGGRTLEFPGPEERYNSDRGVVILWGRDRETRVRCEISRAALDDHFHGDNKGKLEALRANRRTIEEIARRNYLAGRTEPDGSVLIRTEEL